MIALLLACGGDTPAWAVQHASVTPSATGLSGIQTWEFFNDAWTPTSGDDAYICARAQTLTGTVTTIASCTDCREVYTITVEELDSDCDDGTIRDEGFAGPDGYAITEVPDSLVDSDPYPGDSFGWQVVYGAETLTPLGWAYAETLDTTGEAGAPGWTNDRAYTLWPGVAWEL